MTAVGAGVQGGCAEFGALFGYASYKHFDIYKELKWKPPGMEKVKKEGHWLFPNRQKSKDIQPWASFLDLPPERDLVGESKAELDRLLAVKSQSELHPDDLKDVAEFLQSSRDEPAARNTVRVAQWLSTKTLARDTLLPLASAILDKIRLRTLDQEDTVEVMALIIKNHAVESAWVVSVINTLLEYDATEDPVVAITSKMFSDLLDLEKWPDSLPPQIVDWFRWLQNSDLSKQSPIKNTTWRGIYNVCASRLEKPSMMWRHLVTWTRYELAYILLHHWATARPSTSSPVPETVILPWHQKRVDFGVPLMATSSPAQPSTIVTEFKVSRHKSLPTRSNSMHKLCPLILMLHVLQKRGIPHIHLTHEVFAILMQEETKGKSKRKMVVWWTFRDLQRHPTLGIPATLAPTLIHHYMEKKTRPALECAMRIFQSVPTVELRQCYTLPLRLVRECNVPASKIWQLLQRETPGEVTPLVFRTTPTNSLSSEHVDLIHLVALQFSNSPRLRTRVAYRRVHECYRFLRDRRAPLRPIMTRALVNAAIIRPFKELIRPPIVLVRYILMIVRQIEGPETARKVDEKLWKMWHHEISPLARIHWREQYLKKVDAMETAIDNDLRVPPQVMPQGRRNRWQLKLWSRKTLMIAHECHIKNSKRMEWKDRRSKGKTETRRLKPCPSREGKRTAERLERERKSRMEWSQNLALRIRFGVGVA
jgi:hypothetical protein